MRGLRRGRTARRFPIGVGDDGGCVATFPHVRVKRAHVLFVRWRVRSYYSGLLGRGVTGVHRAGTVERTEI